MNEQTYEDIDNYDRGIGLILVTLLTIGLGIGIYLIKTYWGLR